MLLRKPFHFSGNLTAVLFGFILIYFVIDNMIGKSFEWEHFFASSPQLGISLEPDELRAMVDGCRTAFSALGKAQFDRAASEEANAQFRRSLYIVKDVAAGDVLDENVVRSIRPGFGLPPKWLPQIIGCRAARDLTRGTPVDLSCVAWDSPV